MAVAALSIPAPGAPNILRLKLPPVPRERWNRQPYCLDWPHLPENAVRLRDARVRRASGSVPKSTLLDSIADSPAAFVFCFAIFSAMPGDQARQAWAILRNLGAAYPDSEGVAEALDVARLRGEEAN